MLIPFHDDNPTLRTSWVTISLAVTNVVVFVYMLTLPTLQRQEFYATWGFVPKRVAQAFDPNVEVEVPLAAVAVNGRQQQVKKFTIPPNRPQFFATLITCMFLHGGWLHLAGNMLFLWVFGNNVEDRLGHGIFLLFYLVGGLLASACHWAIAANTPAALLPTVGASGAVAAVLGAYAVTYPTARVKTFVFLFIITVIELPAMLVLGLWFLMQLLSGLNVLNNVDLDGGVAFWAHIGGFVAGLLLMPLLCFGSSKPGQSLDDEMHERFTIE
ncbi:MAG: rhomboid family intramembrane serine protease [Pirellulales bacterium]